MVNQRPKSVEVFYTKSNDYRICAVNGVYGGVTPRGDLKIDFIIDSNLVPESAEYEITQEGSFGKELKKTPDGSAKIQRQSQVAILLSIGNAESVAKWILQKVNEVRAAEKTPEGPVQ